MSLDACTVGVAVILGAVAALLCAWYDQWMNPNEYEHLRLKGDK